MKSPLQRRRPLTAGDFEIIELAQPLSTSVDERYERSKPQKVTYARTLRAALFLALAGITTLLLVIFLSKPVPHNPAWHAASLHENATKVDRIDLSTRCPLHYTHLSMADINAGTKPYILGGRQQPACTNCNLDTLWSHFCQFQSHGPTCDTWLQWELLEYYKNNSFLDFLTLSPCEFWPFLKNRTVFLLGDSQMLDTYKALKCFLFEFWDVKNEVDPLLTNDPELLPLLTHNQVPPSCVHLPQQSRICFMRVDKVGQLVNVVLPRYNKFGSRHDIMIINFGLWLKDPMDYGWELDFLEAFYKVFKRCLPFIIWKDTPMQHFDTIYGEYPGKRHAEEPFVCAPIRNVTLHANHSLTANSSIADVVLEGGWRNKMSGHMMRRMGLPLVSSWNDTLDLWKYHKVNAKGLMECTHFCHPSAPQVWVWAIHQTLRNSVEQLNSFLAAAPVVSEEPECALLHGAGLKGEGDHMFLLDLVPAFYKDHKPMEWHSMDLPFTPQDDEDHDNLH